MPAYLNGGLSPQPLTPQKRKSTLSEGPVARPSHRHIGGWGSGAGEGGSGPGMVKGKEHKPLECKPWIYFFPRKIQGSQSECREGVNALVAHSGIRSHPHKGEGPDSPPGSSRSEWWGAGRGHGGRQSADELIGDIFQEMFSKKRSPGLFGRTPKGSITPTIWWLNSTTYACMTPKTVPDNSLTTFSILYHPGLF